MLPIVLASGIIGNATWTSDSRALLFLTRAGDANQVVSLAVDGGTKAAPQTAGPLPRGLFVQTVPRLSLSPNGRLLAYVAGAAPRPVVMVMTFPSLSSRVQVSSEGAWYPQWSSKGDEVWFVQGNDLMAAPIVSSNTGELTAGPLRKLFTPPSGLRLTDGIKGKLFGTVDAKEFVLIDDRHEGDQQVTVIQNVHQLLRAPRK